MGMSPQRVPNLSIASELFLMLRFAGFWMQIVLIGMESAP